MSIKMDLRQEKKLHGSRKIRVNSSLDQDTHHKLKKLAIACDKTKTSMSAEIIKIVVNHTDFIEFLQNKYNQDEQYRIIPVRKGGQTYY